MWVWNWIRCIRFVVNVSTLPLPYVISVIFLGTPHSLSLYCLRPIIINQSVSRSIDRSIDLIRACRKIINGHIYIKMLSSCEAHKLIRSNKRTHIQKICSNKRITRIIESLYFPVASFKMIHYHCRWLQFNNFFSDLESLSRHKIWCFIVFRKKTWIRMNTKRSLKKKKSFVWWYAEQKRDTIVSLYRMVKKKL